MSPLTVHPRNPRYFRHPETGEAIVLMGAFSLAADWYVPPQMATADPDRIRDGFAAVRQDGHSNVARLWHFTPWALPDGALAPYARVPGAGSAHDGFPKFDLNRWDEAFWQRLNFRVRQAADAGLVYQVMLFERCGLSRSGRQPPDRWFQHPFNPDNHVDPIPGLPGDNGDAREGHAFYDLSNAVLLRHQEAYADRLVRELSAYWNVIFEVCNEYCDLDYHPGPADWEAHWVRFIRERCSHPVMVNNLGRNTDPPGTPERYWSMPDLDAVSWHTIWPEEAYQRFVRFHDRGKAMIHGEQAFSANENTARPRTMSARDLRHLAWGAFLGGGHLIWDESNGEDDRDALVATRGVLRFLRETGFDVLTARPRPDLTFGAWALANDRQAVIYSPQGAAFTLPDAALPPGCRWRWFDPVAASFGPDHRCDGTGALPFEPPGGRDQVLLVDRDPSAT